VTSRVRAEEGSLVEERRVRNRQARAPVGPQGTDVRQEIIGLLFAAAGVYFVLALAGRGGGWLGGIISSGLRSIAGGYGAWMAALFLFWLGLHLIYLRYHKQPFTWGWRATGLLILMLGVLVVFQLWAFGGHPQGGEWENALNGLGGGMIGFALTRPLTTVFGAAGRYVVLVAFMLVGLVLNTEMTFGGVLHWGKERLEGGARNAKGVAGDFYTLVTTRPKGEKEPKEPKGTAEPLVGRPRQAASEDLNTIGPRAKADPKAEPRVDLKAGPMADMPVIRIPPPPPEPAHPGTGSDPAKAEPVIRRAEPPPWDDKVTDMGARAAKSVQAASDKPTVKLVPNARGQLQVDPDKLGGSYTLPTIQMLPKPIIKVGASKQDHLERAGLLERTLKTFGVEARVIEISPGPAITRYELQPGEGVRVNKFTVLADDLALALAAEDIRIEAPIPGKSAVGIEVPNKERLAVPLREVMETPLFQGNPSRLAIAFGKDNAGNPVVGDLAKMPHLLIAGSTGSGKSVCMNTIICSILFKARPDEVKMLMVDPKMVELSTYNGIPHLMAPVITDTKKAAGYLKGAVKEMENRYELFAASGARNIQQYNQMCLDDPGPDPEHPRKPLPFIVIFIDELADLMMVAPVDVEDAICRLAQMARACGMHLVIATQSPRVDVITGLIKANIPSRVAFAVSSQVDSRVIMDYAGAERLLGRGDMLYHPTGLSKAMRAQGAFIGDKEVEELVKFVSHQAKPVFTAEEVAVDVSGGKSRGGGGGAGGAENGEPASSAADAIFPQAVRVVIEHGQASVSILQRRLRCNYNKAARLIDMMEERGFIGPHQGSKPRDVLITIPQWRDMFKDADETAATDDDEE
jgi:S-DNA-T family DNA segregation ATPase FtsK/SpoIIIE